MNVFLRLIVAIRNLFRARFLNGEEDFEDVSIIVLVENFIVKYTCHLYSVFNVTYEIQLPEPRVFNEEASVLLYLLCRERKHFSVLDMVQLLELGADPNYVRHNEREMTALLWSVKSGRYAAVVYLVRAGADINAVNTLHQNALMLAWYYGFIFSLRCAFT